MTETERKVYEANTMPLAFYQERDGRILPLLVSDGFCQMKGLPRDKLMKLLSTSIYDEVHPDEVGVLNIAADAIRRQTAIYDVVYHSRCTGSREFHLVHALGKWQTFEDGTRAVIVIYNDLAQSVSQIAKYYEEYKLIQQDQLYTDHVTGLPNMNYMRQFTGQRVEQTWLREKTPMLVYFDIRNMHSYNYEYGYARGDALLCLAAEEIKAAFPNGLVARGTEDHFIVIDDFREDIQALAEAVVESIRKKAYGKFAGIQASVVKMTRDLKPVDALDRAKHVLKDIGDDLNVTVSFFSQRNNEAYWMRRYTIQSFDQALENNWIKVYYQAIERTQTQKLTILEALARWIDPGRGVIEPREFIPVLSRYHQLYRLDLYMAEQICKEFGEREKLGLPLVPVSVNFSAQDFDYVNIPAKLDELMEKYGLEKRCLIVEITEQDIAQATEQFKEQLRRLHESGYRLWIDDFGSGYSSLNVFSQYHVDRIKFDMEMLRHLDDNNGANRIIMKSMVEMCRKMGVHTLAEGVETKEQFQFLREIDCEMAQGFYFFKPESLEMSRFKLLNNGPMLECETREERKRLCAQWLKGPAQGGE